MTIPSLRVYKAVTRLSPFRDYRKTAVLVAVMAVIPPAAAVVVALPLLSPEVVRLALFVAIVLAVSGAALVLFGLYQLLAPITLTNASLTAYLQHGRLLELPTHHTADEAGLLMANAQIVIRRLDSALRYLAHHDTLTGLPNRAAFAERVRQALLVARRTGQPLAVLVMDLNNFRNINHTYGHPSGDALLKAVAERLSGYLRETDSFSRLGDDRFGALLLDARSIEGLLACANRLLEGFVHPFLVEGRDLYVSLNIGIALYPADAEEVESLLRNADAALAQAKKRGRNTYQFYAPGLNAKLQRRLELESDLRQAVQRGELQLHYQPQVEVDTGAITGVETLLRWYHPRLGIIPPAEFIPLAEETGLIIPLGEWVLRQACTQGRRWEAAGLPAFTIAVNLSARQFRHQGLAETIAEVLRETGLPAARLELEVTESSLVEDLPHATRMLHQLRAMGVSIALDDFGSGYSSLGYLRSFPITTLKIDRLFLQDVPANPDCSAMLRGLKALASSLGLQLLVEGVETAAQLECLQAFACERAQGFLLSRALPAEVLTSRLSKGRFETLFGRLGAATPVVAG